ncbi:hypothetical protein HW132_33200 [Brasilonema sp. CT11]|nr:hypothetical protein [Brasilonema sp. CT11]
MNDFTIGIQQKFGDNAKVLNIPKLSRTELIDLLCRIYPEKAEDIRAWTATEIKEEPISEH